MSRNIFNIILHDLFRHMHAKSLQSCPFLCDPMDCSPPDFSVHGFLQARILKWVAISFSRGSPQPRDWTQISHIAGRFFTIWVNREALRVVLKTDRGLDQLWMRKKEAGRKRRLFKNAEICWLYDTYIYKYIFNVYLIYTNMCECMYMYVCAYICACI